MFNVTTVNLSSDFRTAQPDLGARLAGGLDARELLLALEAFRSVDAVQNHDAEPQLVIATSRRKYIVRTGHGKLFLYDARDSSVPFVELDAAGVVREVARDPAVAGPDADAPEIAVPRRRFQYLVAAAILLGGVALNGYTIFSVFYIQTVDPKPPVQLVTDARELAGLTTSAQGRYATGREPGDRIIEVNADGRIRFLRHTAAGERLDAEDAFRVGRTNRKVCLATAESGVIDVENIDTLTYYRDVYRRQ